MYYYARPLQQGTDFPRSYSGFYSVNNEQLSTLVTGFEGGGSMGGDSICFWKDDHTGDVFIGSYYHHGGFGGYAYGGSIYKHNNGNAIPIISFGYIDQTLRNYDENYLLENACLLYDTYGMPYTKEAILQAAEDYNGATEYLVNGMRTSVEKYREASDRYSIHALWWWGGY